MSKDRSISGGTATGTGGFQTGRGASASRLPSAPRERKPALAALAVLLILAGALATMTLVTRSGNRVDVVKMANTVAAGQQIAASDFVDASVAADSSMNYVLWDQRGQLIGKTTYNPLVAGSLLIPAMIGSSTDTTVPKGEVVIGVQVKPGHYPFQWLSKNDKVNVYGGTPGAAGSTPATSAPTTGLLGVAQIVFFTTGDTMNITLAAAPDVADKIIAAGDSLTITKTIG